MIIQHNLTAMNASRMYGINDKAKEKSTQKLSSGYKINRSADDAAGLAISEKMRRQIRGLTQASLNVQDGVSFVQTAEGALSETHEILQRMNELAVKAANGTNTDEDRTFINSEVQQLKTELNRIFNTTTFNEKLIWDPDAEGQRQVGSVKKQVIEYQYYSKYFEASNNNIGVLPSDGINVLANKTDGVSFSWKGYNGKTYTTGSISFEDLEANNYSVNLSSLYDNATETAVGGTATPTNALKNASPPFNPTISLTKPTEAATKADIVNTINNTTLTSYVSVGIRAQFEDSTGNSLSSPLSMSAGITTAAAYKSLTDGASGKKFSFDNGEDNFYSPDTAADPLSQGSGSGNVSAPSYSDVASAKTDSSTWAVSFKLDGIGDVTAKISGISYSSNDTSAAAKGTWWDTYTYPDGSSYNYTIGHSADENTLKGFMDILVGDYSDGTPGLLSSANGGCNNSSGSITMSFDIKDSSNNSVGSLSIGMSVSTSDTEDTILNKLSTYLNKDTIIDLYNESSDVTTNGSGIGSWVYANSAYNRTNLIDQPIYTATNDFFVHSGSEAEDEIHIKYDALSTYYLGIGDTDVDTVEGAKSAIDEVKAALNEVSKQRSDFGAYQNRLEHCIKNLDNVVENTTAAESQIRDTDMATEMVQLSLTNILQQAGVSMMAQANQSGQQVLSLLQA